MSSLFIIFLFILCFGTGEISIIFMSSLFQMFSWKFEKCANSCEDRTQNNFEWVWIGAAGNNFSNSFQQTIPLISRDCCMKIFSCGELWLP